MNEENDDIPSKAELEEKILLTWGEIQFIDRILSEAETTSIIPLSTAASTYTPLRTIREKLSEANSQVNQRHRELKNERDCGEEGHVWGSTYYHEESDHGEIVVQGCRYCPAAQYKKVGEDSEWQTVEEWNDLGIPVHIGGPQE